VLGGIAGAIATYFFDPDRGRGRRTRMRDRMAGTVRRGRARLERTGRHISSDVEGFRRRIEHPTPEDVHPDDATLAQKVRSEIFGRGDIDDSRLNVNAERGVVVLRGEFDRPEQINDLERRVRRIPGVIGVRNLVHLKNTTPQEVQEPVEAGRRGPR
jgi:hypothetical protein